MDERNKDCAYWQEGESNCKILTYKNCPEKCIWKQTRAERRHRKRACRARIKNIPRYLDEVTPVKIEGVSIPLVKDKYGNVYPREIVAKGGTDYINKKYYRLRSKMSLEGNE